jgi:hypothetical protein
MIFLKWHGKLKRERAMRSIKKMVIGGVLWIALVPALFTGSGCSSPSLANVKGYQQTDLDGRIVMVEDELLADPNKLALVLDKLADDLENIEEYFHMDALRGVKDTIVWLNDDRKLGEPYACYYSKKSHFEFYPDKSTLKFKGIELFDTDLYLNRPGPFIGDVMLHEFVHAFNFSAEFSKKLQGELWAAYSSAKMDDDLYKSVDYRESTYDVRAYAMSNMYEYLTELTEAYFTDDNDFFPHTREQLKEYDPLGYDAMVQIWGK